MTQSLALWTAATPNGWKVSIMIEELRELEIALPFNTPVSAVGLYNA